jgi:uncharacterized Rmd1/YagE family protein
MYHLPLLPGYGPNANIRSSAPLPAHARDQTLADVEDAGYQGTYFASSPPTRRARFDPADGYISTSPTEMRRAAREPDTEGEGDATETETEPLLSPPPDLDALLSPPASAAPFTTPEPSPSPLPETPLESAHEPAPDHAAVAEVVFFAYGVVVFFGLDEAQERGVLEDIAGASALRRPLNEARWEIEELYYAVRAPFPRVRPGGR